MIQRRADAQLGAVDGVGHEIDRQLTLHAQFGSGLDCLDPAGLIEAKPIVLVDLRQHGGGRLAGDAAHQRLMSEDLPAAQVDDRLKGVAEAEAQAFAAGAAGAGAVLVGAMTGMGIGSWGVAGGA